MESSQKTLPKSVQLQATSLLRKGDRRLVPLRYRQVADAWLISNDFGGHIFVDNDAFERLQNGTLQTDEPTWAALQAQDFVVADLRRKELSDELKHKRHFLFSGPNLHIFVVTLRCNHTCQYCHASRAPMNRIDTDMSVETAERSVDFAFESPSPGLTIEFQGGEPLANWEVVQHIIEYSLQKNALARKSVMFALVTNLSLMDQEKLDYLIDRRVQICTSLDGPADVHDAVRLWSEGSSHATVTGWMNRINQRYTTLGLEENLYKVEALPTVTRPLLAQAERLIDHYAELGCRSIFLRHLDPFGWAATTKAKLGYSMAEFLEFYQRAYFRVIELNRNGTDFVERTAALMVSKILGRQEPNFLDLRSPCGAGIGQIAYNYDGRLFTCDEGRMIDRNGDDTFCLGHVDESQYRETISGPSVRAMVLASTLEGQPHCASCVYKPWCGVCPVHNYSEQGSLHGRMADSTWCQKYMGLFDFLMSRVRLGDEFERGVLQRWATPRSQEHFLQQAPGPDAV